MMPSFPVSRYRSSAEVLLPSDAVLIFGTLEERSVLPPQWNSIEKLELVEDDTLSGFLASGRRVDLRRAGSLDALLGGFRGRPVFLDYTGLSHHVWMPIVRRCVELDLSLSCIYSEPESYQQIPNPRPSEFFDLSSKVRGIEPIPTFARLADKLGRQRAVVPLLGFEGTRFRYILETLQPEGRDIYPVIGVPGFRLEFPFHAYQGNADALSANNAWENVRRADAACPFALYELLDELQRGRDDRFLQISPIGTKPHALGAAIYALVHPETELIYDHPVRKKQRSRGAGPCHVYDVSNFVRSLARPVRSI